MKNRFKKNEELYAIYTLNEFKTFDNLKEAQKFILKNFRSGFCDTIIYIVNSELNIVGYNKLKSVV